MNKKNKGFTIIEVILTIAVIITILGLATHGVINIINNSKSKKIELTSSNIKNTSRDYIHENNKTITWIKEEQDKEFTCVSIQALINYGYYTKKIINDNNIDPNSYIKINRTVESKTIINEEFNESINEICSSYYVKIPKCNNNTYDGNEKLLIDELDSKYQVTYTNNNKEFNNLETDAGEYKLTLSLIPDNDFSWDDGKIENKNITCKIKQKMVTIKLNTISLLISEFNNNDYIGDKEKIKEQLTVKGLIDDHQIIDFKAAKNNEGTKLYVSDVKISTSVGIDVTSNYKIPEKVSGKLIIINNSIEIPTTSICKNLTYNGRKQILAIAPKYVTLSNSSATNAGSYNVIASIGDEYVWTDGTKDAKTITCNIKKSTSNVELSNKTASYTGNNIDFEDNDVTIKDINNEKVIDYNAIYSFTYYSDSSCKTQITTHKNVGTYYGKVNISNLTNYNDVTSNCASLSIIDKSKLTYNPNGGSVNPTSKEIETGKAYGTLPTPTRTGYTFKGWFTTASGGTKINSTTIVTNTNNHSIYAQWTANTLSICFYPNGGTLNSDRSYDSTKCGGKGYLQTIKYDNENISSFNMYNVDTLYTKTGYKVPSNAEAWRYGSATSKTYINQKTQDLRKYISKEDAIIKLYANWVAKTLTIKFMRNYNANDKTVFKTETFTYGIANNRIKDTIPSRTGYSFLGWSESQNATTATYHKTNGIGNNFINSHAPSIIWYAVWTDNIKPTCSITTSNAYSTSGISTKVTCSDSGSGCKTGTQKDDNLKSSKTYTVYDKAGNKGTCTVTVSSRTRYRTAQRCSKAGCSSYSCSSGSLTGAYCKIVFKGVTAEDKCRKNSSSCTCSDTSGGGRTPNQTCYYTKSATCSTYNQSGSICGWNSWSSASCSVSSNKCESKKEYY